MDNTVQQAQAELDSHAEAPKSLEEVVNGLLSFGIEENEEILTVVASGRTVKLRLSNIPIGEETLALIAVEELKGYMWVQKIKCEILSRAVSWIDGVNIKALSPLQRMVTDPTENKHQRDVQVVLRNVMLGWGQELIGVLWKVFMVHCDKIEKRLQNAFPDSVILTEIEKRFMDQAMKEIEEAAKAVIADTVAEAIDPDSAEKDPQS